MPVADVTDGLVAEYAFADSLADSFARNRVAKVVSGKFSYIDGRLGRAGDLDDSQLSFGSAGELRKANHSPWPSGFNPDGPSGMQILQRYSTTEKNAPGYEIAARL